MLITSIDECILQFCMAYKGSTENLNSSVSVLMTERFRFLNKDKRETQFSSFLFNGRWFLDLVEESHIKIQNLSCPLLFIFKSIT